MSEFPAHASPGFAATGHHLRSSRNVSDLYLSSKASVSATSETAVSTTGNNATSRAASTRKPPPPIISPAITPPLTPGDTASSLSVYEFTGDRPTSTLSPGPSLLPTLPEVECIVRARIPTTEYHELFLHVYHNNVDAKEHLAIVFGDKIRSRSLDAPKPGETEKDRLIRGAYQGRLYPGRTTSRIQQLKRDAGVDPRSSPRGSVLAGMVAEEMKPEDVAMPAAPLVRIHSECYTGETVWSARCDCGEQLDEAARQMSEPSSGGGVIIYLRQEGRGIGLGEKLKAYNLQDLGNDTVEANLLLRHPADARSYGLATAMLQDLGLGGDEGIRLLTNNPDKVRAVEGPNREVVVRERVPMTPLAWSSGGKKGVRGKEVEKYLSTKIEKFKHNFT